MISCLLNVKIAWARTPRYFFVSLGVRKSTPLQTRKIACIFMFKKVIFIFTNISVKYIDIYEHF